VPTLISHFKRLLIVGVSEFEEREIDVTEKCGIQETRPDPVSKEFYCRRYTEVREKEGSDSPSQRRREKDRYGCKE